MVLFFSLSAFVLVSLAVLIMGSPWLRRYYAITCAAALLFLLYIMYVRPPEGDESWHTFCLKIYPILVLQAAPFSLLFYGAYTAIRKSRLQNTRAAFSPAAARKAGPAE